MDGNIRMEFVDGKILSPNRRRKQDGAEDEVKESDYK
jgi:hypothetical protein